MGDATVWGMIDAQPIVFPAPVQQLNSAFLELTVPTEAARTLMAGDAFEIVESAPGSAHLVVAAQEYIRGAWGPCNALEIAIRARPAGGPEETTGVYLCDAPVSQEFIREAAYRTLGSAKRLEAVETVTTDDDVTFSLACGGEPALTLRLPRVTTDAAPVPVTVRAYTYLDGEPYVVPFEMDVPTGVVDPAEVDIEVGTGWFADMLRVLGLPRTPDRCVWGERLTALFHLAVPLAKAGDATRVQHQPDAGPVRYPRCFYASRRAGEVSPA